MDQLLVLQTDKRLARQRIKELEEEIRSMGPEFQAALTQTSETWHDNAPFDALRERQAVLATELGTLHETLHGARLSLPKQPKDKVGVGSIVRTDQQSYFVAGDWSMRVGRRIEGAIVISRRSPLAQAMIGKRVGDKFNLGPKRLTVTEIKHKEP